MRFISPLLLIILASAPAQAAEPAVYYCEMKKKIAVDEDGRVKEYELTKFKFKDYKILENGEGLIELGKGLGFPNRLDNLSLHPETYYGEDFWRGYEKAHALLHFFNKDTLFLSTSTSQGHLTVVSKCEKF